MTDLVETVYPGKDNTFKVEVKQGGTLVDFSTATRFVLDLNGTELLQIDTDTAAGAITGDASGILTFDLGEHIASDKTGFYLSRLCVYDPLHTDGQVVIDYCSPNHQDLNVRVCEA